MTIQFQHKQPSIESLTLKWCIRKQIGLKVLRLDLLHPHLGGNKWFKLRLNLEQARQQGKNVLLSFGGAYSNHLRALAAAGKRFGFKTIGLVRGELTEPLNPVLQFAQEQGMHLVPMDRTSYRLKHTESFLTELQENYADAYVIPEGGSNRLGVLGCKEIVNFLPPGNSGESRILALACGTAATMSGLIAGIAERNIQATEVLGFSVLKASGYLSSEIETNLSNYFPEQNLNKVPWKIEERFHGGGYAKSNPELNGFLSEWQQSSSMPIEPVYTGKLFWGLKQMIELGEIERGSEVIALHSGGVYS
ncbi:MAG: pyridoxal-phosphate dependent enzyme [Pseudomonadales bacterium]|nr:pyridoxal-phosphate dependent enzyme [Pseudomonadales bacterium]